MSFKIDLHCHSLVSDGTLSPTQVIERAVRQQITDIALTDHDTTAGLAEAEIIANKHKINLMSGIELSTSWHDKCLHVVGLNIDQSYLPLQEGIKELKDIRNNRAEKIAQKLANKGFKGAMDLVYKNTKDGIVTRTHFADFLVAGRHVNTFQEAFDKYLAAGKSAFVASQWIPLVRAVSWIKDSGGVAILAHPLRYKLKANQFKHLLIDFKEAGGVGIEVVTGNSNPDTIRTAAYYAAKFDLYGSVGSDFHKPGNPRVELGCLAALPNNIKPVWDIFK